MGFGYASQPCFYDLQSNDLVNDTIDNRAAKCVQSGLLPLAKLYKAHQIIQIENQLPCLWGKACQFFPLSTLMLPIFLFSLIIPNQVIWTSKQNGGCPRLTVSYYSHSPQIRTDRGHPACEENLLSRWWVSQVYWQQSARDQLPGEIGNDIFQPAHAGIALVSSMPRHIYGGCRHL